MVRGMAYITIRQGERELGWRELGGPLTVGRQRECELCLIDSRLSRAHCRFEREGDDWAIVDLGSRNGTWCDGISIDRVLLLDGDHIHVGRLTFTFHEGAPPSQGKYTPRLTKRPADPREAMNETVAGITVVERPRDPWLAQGRRAQPRPMPRELRPEETGIFAAVLEAPVELDIEKPLRSYRPPRVRQLPRPLLMELPDSPALDDQPRKRPSSPVDPVGCASAHRSRLGVLKHTLQNPQVRTVIAHAAGISAALAAIVSCAAWAGWQWWNIFK
jgi:hypothetical protein